MNQKLLGFKSSGTVLMFLLLFSGVLISCSTSASESKYCQELTRAEVDLAHLASSVDEITTINASDLRDAFETGLASLSQIAESSPENLADDYLIIFDAYNTVSTELKSFNWSPALYLNDTSSSQVSFLHGEEMNLAMDNISADAIDRCKINVDFVIDGTETAVTLPQPAVPDDSSLDREISLENGSSNDRALGFTIAERYALAVTDDQATCIGSRFNALPVRGDLSDAEMDAIYQDLFVACGLQPIG